MINECILPETSLLPLTFLFSLIQRYTFSQTGLPSIIRKLTESLLGKLGITGPPLPPKLPGTLSDLEAGEKKLKV